MKRSRTVQRLLLGGFTAGLAAAAAGAAEPRVTADNLYTNDVFIRGAGHYHAPFRAFFPLPYNHYDPQRQMYYYGGQWGPAPHRSIVNISAPSAEAARAAELARTDRPGPVAAPVARSGFGSTSRSHYSGS